jgi:hypothetical protein
MNINSLAEILHFINRNVKQLKLKAMKKVVVLSLMSLLFLATFAQRPSKSRSTEVNENDRNKSEVTTNNRSHENASRSVDLTNTTNNSNQHPDNGNNNRNNTVNRSDDRPDNVNDNRNIADRSYDHPDNMNNNRTYTPRINNPGDDIRKESDDHMNRSLNDKIVNTKTEVHKNIESHSGYTANSGRGRSINSRTYEVERKNYHSPNGNHGHHEAYHHANKPRPIEYRRVYYPYYAPVDVYVYWTPRMYHEYMMIYPDYRYWYYPNGYMIRTISAYDAMYYIGEVVNVFGRVHETWYSRETDEYILYFGAGYPYQDFSIVIPGKKARQFSHRPEIFFEGRYMWVTGLISLNQGQPEMIVMKKHQIHLY